MNKIIKILVVLIIIVGLIVFIKYFKEQRIKFTYDIAILGDSEYIIYETEEYQEPGFSCSDYLNNDCESLVKIDNNININKVGSYHVDYSINSFWKKNKVTRTVIVKENPFDNLKFSLKGNSVSIKLKDNYHEPGYNIDSGFEKYVNVENNVNNLKVGNYVNKYILKIGE